MTSEQLLRHRLSLRLRSLLLVFGIMLLMLVLGSSVLLYVARGAVEEEVEAGVGLASLLVDGTLHAADPRGLLPVRDVLQGLQSLRHVDVVLDSRPVKLGRIESGRRAPKWFSSMLRPEDSIPTYRLPVELGKNIDYVTIRPNPNDEINEIWKDFKLLVTIAAIAMLLTGTLIYLAIWRGLIPLKNLQAAFGRLEQGYFDTRIETPAPRELASLQESFNHMAAVLETNVLERRRLAGRIVSMQEQDWRGLAREVHDELSPQLFRLRAEAAALAEMQHDAADKASRHLVKSIGNAVEGLQSQVQSLYKRLRPQALDELGLEGAVKDLVDNWRKQYPDIEWSLEQAELPRPLSDMINVTIYRVVQECLTNAARHSGASRIGIRIVHEPADSMIVVSVSDNGHGLGEATPTAGFGLSGMRERLAALGGSLEQQDSRNGGLTLHAKIPILQDIMESET